MMSICKGISGSSPLVRGQRRLFRFARRTGRIIPARAGPTRLLPRRSCPLPDHPRSCGANQNHEPRRHAEVGSSPLVRGQLPVVQLQSVGRRIIPARAGPTQRPGRRGIPEADHPRSCGANLPVTDAVAGLAGSSPLVRGQLGSSRLPPRSCRIIPARAGPTQRVREPARGLQGSSPLVRGQPIHSIQKVVWRNPRIIPARAGPTPAR